LTAAAISAQGLLSVDSYDTMNIATPAIVYGCLPYTIYNSVIFSAVYLDAF
jgi:hypothetical protein